MPRLDLYHATLTQKYDKSTAEAMAIFQSNNPPLRVDGVATPLALTQMGIYSGVDSEPPPPVPRRCPAGHRVEGRFGEVSQDKLKEDGFLQRPVTGTFDKLTADAVRAFQLATPPLGTDGVAGPSTLAAMGIWSGKTTEQGGPVVPRPRWSVAGRPRAVPQLEPHPRRHSLLRQPRACTKANADTIANEFEKDGADDATQQWAVYIASREGGCNETRQLQLGDPRRLALHVPTQRAGRDVRAARRARSARLDHRQRQGVDAELCRRGQRLWVYCGRGPWTPPYACAPPWAGDLGFGDA